METLAPGITYFHYSAATVRRTVEPVAHSPRLWSPTFAPYPSPVQLLTPSSNLDSSLFAFAAPRIYLPTPFCQFNSLLPNTHTSSHSSFQIQPPLQITPSATNTSQSSSTGLVATSALNSSLSNIIPDQDFALERRRRRRANGISSGTPEVNKYVPVGYCSIPSTMPHEHTSVSLDINSAAFATVSSSSPPAAFSQVARRDNLFVTGDCPLLKNLKNYPLVPPVNAPILPSVFHGHPFEEVTSWVDSTKIVLMAKGLVSLEDKLR